MKPFVLTQDSPLSPADAWAKITDWPQHGRYVPLTTMRVEPPGPSHVGTVFTARTAVGPIGFDDPMEIVQWSPPAVSGGSPGHCRMEKRGKVVLGWAEITVAARAGGSRVTWTEAARPRGLPRFAEPLANLTARMLFGRVLRKLLS